MSTSPSKSSAEKRCAWSFAAPDFLDYHDGEWGRPVGEDRRLFEKLCLEGFQSGLSWRTILEKRENFRKAFFDFDFERVARFRESDVTRLLGNAGIVRHRGKIEATIKNARAVRELVREEGSLGAFVWRHEPPPLAERLVGTRTTSPEAIALAKELKKRGFSFVGPTTVYSFMQAMGLINDHSRDCFVRARIERERSKFQRPR